MDGELGAARDFAAAGGRDARVQSGVFRFDVLEDQGQGVLLILVGDFESFLGVVLVPLEFGFLSWRQKGPGWPAN